MDDLSKSILSGESLMRQAVMSLRLYHEACRIPASAEEIERLRLEAEWLFKAVSEFQLQALGHQTLNLQ